MTYRVVLQPRALRDIDETCIYLAERYSRESAEAWYDGCLQAIQSLSQNPDRCQMAREAQKLGVDLRQRLYRRYRSTYRVLFVIRGEAVRIVCVRHASRDRLTRKDVSAEDLT
jgi:plasmid stabilization system protein ParE